MSSLPPAPDTATPQPGWIRLAPWIIIALVLIAIGVIAGQWGRFEADRAIQVTDNASIQNDAVVLDSRAAGYVRTVAFSDFQHVRKGQLLVQLEDEEFRADVLRAEAALARAQATLDNLANELAAQRAMVAQARANARSDSSKLQLAEADDQRFAALASTGAVTGQEADSARANAGAIRAAQAGSVAAVELQNRQLDVLAGTREQRQADVLAARAELARARIALSFTRIIAPADGIVGQRHVQPGSLLAPGTAVANFVPETPPYVVANYKETQLSRIAPGQQVDITIDSYPGEVLHGRVSRLAPASGATFAAIPADNATGNFTKVTQRVPLRIDLLPDQPLAARLRAGMSATTRIITR
ncbi:HlyD family efflux transporter periplasmic adaptor subunit [Altererythrobacter xixiisoli]|uniref:HlyD family efflux transporter periplasmic adaptor subunit n=1 Tax=Croceibacterium xixiisoli TaxID=1476466 RepID=A0A6I4TP57_9SPHN|nr:HlyD family secretion protein [Croceibacterium xixiisoli]MXO97702.1 HlyD family efflux transporter periplasmic adaptor subunit [Croceibacterium xixiisoli]